MGGVFQVISFLLFQAISAPTLYFHSSASTKAVAVDIAMGQAYYEWHESPIVDLKYTNNTKRSMKIPKKLVPSNDFWNDIFVIRVGYKRAKYIGKLFVYKSNVAPYKLAPGESISAKIDLSKKSPE